MLLIAFSRIFCLRGKLIITDFPIMFYIDFFSVRIGSFAIFVSLQTRLMHPSVARPNILKMRAYLKLSEILLISRHRWKLGVACSENLKF